MHLHAPQTSYAGTATDKPLMAWLDEYTFPREARHANLALAKAEYQKLIRRLIDNGTTTALYFASLWLEPTKLFADLLHMVTLPYRLSPDASASMPEPMNSTSHALLLNPPSLACSMLQAGQRAYVGLVCMDRNSKDFYTKSLEENLQDTEAFICHVRSVIP